MASSTSRKSITPTSTDVVSNTTTETAFSQKITIPAYTLKGLTRLQFGGAVISTATNSTDTLTVKAYLGTAADNTGHLLFDSGALDVANNDAAAFEGWCQVKTAGGASTGFLAGFSVGAPKSAGTLKGTTVDAVEAQFSTIADMYLVVTATWSVASASNSCRLDALWADIINYAN